MISKLKKPFIIAEIGNNHEGSFKTAKKLILEAYKAGVDAVKFQTFRAEEYVNEKDKNRFNRLKKFELSNIDFEKLAKFAKKKKLKFISTPFDLESAKFLNSIVDYFKISSGDNNYFQLIKKVLSFRKPTLISTGMLNFIDINNLIKFIKKNKFPTNKLILLHCVSSYPAKDREANLRSIKFLKKKLKIKIGYSDHTLGIVAPIIASAYGASVIEKHFTLSKKYSNFRDHQISADPNEMKRMVYDIRRTSEMLGKNSKKISNTEKKNINSMRRSIYAKKNIKKNIPIKPTDIKIVRPFKDLYPYEINKILKKKSKKYIKKNEAIIRKYIN